MQTLERILTWKIAEGTAYGDITCSSLDTADLGTPVRCTYLELGGAARAVGAPPVEVIATFTISSDGIERWHQAHRIIHPTDLPFHTWLDAAHPELPPGSVVWRRIGYVPGQWRPADPNWDSVEEARLSGLLAASLAQEWADYLEQRGCTFWAMKC